MLKNRLKAFLRCCVQKTALKKHVLEILILTQNDNFAKAIAFALWPILAMMEKLPFFEY